MTGPDIKNNSLTASLLCFGASAVLLTVIQTPFDMGYLGWFALVPFILACRGDSKAWRLTWVSYVVGSIYWLGNLYWIGYVTVPGYILLAMSFGLYWPVVALCVRYCRRVKLPLFIAVPFLIVGAEAWQGVLYTGFNWRLLGHSQYLYLPVIQIADIFGQLGVSFLVAMVNGVIAEVYIDGRGHRSMRIANLVKTSIVGAAVAGTLFYGYYRIDEANETITQGPVVGSVQTNIPSLVKERAEAGEAILDELIERSDECFANGAKLVAWPETIVLASLNRDFIQYCYADSTPVVFHNRISEHVKGKGYILLGAHAINLKMPEEEITDRYNSAYMYRPDGKQDLKRFDKIHLVPFGEYIPFKDGWPWFYDIILKLSPYDYPYDLTKGSDYTIFEIADGEQKYGFGCLICYEDTDADVTRKIVVGPDGVKRADWLVNLSNDGWYVRYKDEKVVPSVELSQRAAITVFRCVENRISVVRSVNTGISCLIDPVGRIRDGYISGDLPEKAMDRQGVAGFFTDSVPIDKRVTYFSKQGRMLDIVCGVLFFATAAFVIPATMIISRRERKSKTSCTDKSRSTRKKGSK